MLLKPYYPVSHLNMQFSLPYFGSASNLSPPQGLFRAALTHYSISHRKPLQRGEAPNLNFLFQTPNLGQLWLKNHTIWHHPYLFCFHEKLPPSCVILPC